MQIVGEQARMVSEAENAVRRETPGVLIVDDDRDLCQQISEFLRDDGFDPFAVHTGIEGVESSLSDRYQIIILDVMLPDMKGFDVLRGIRSQTRTPVLMLTAKGSDYDRILGLELGADDYLPKPFNPRELTARLAAILRRSGWQQQTSSAMRPPVLRSD